MKKTITRESLLNHLATSFKVNKGEYHTAEEINDVLQSALADYGKPNDKFSSREDLDKLRDAIGEITGSNTPIYTNELLEWLAKNYSVLEEYQQNYGTIGEIIEKQGLPQAIICAFSFSLEQEVDCVLVDLYEDIVEQNEKTNL